jgi:hypothetical protein
MNSTDIDFNLLLLDLKKTTLKAKILGLLVPGGDFNESVTRYVPPSFVAKHYEHFPDPDVVPGDYASAQEDIEMLKRWLMDPIYDLPEKFDAFKAACASHWRKRNEHYEAQDLSILKKYLDYLVDALM